MINNLSLASYNALISLWQSFVTFLPTFLGGLIVYLIGIILGNGLAQIIEKIIDALKIDHFLEKTGFKDFTDRADIKLNSGYFVGQVVKWLLVLSFLVASCNIWGLVAVGDFIRSIVAYIPNVIVAILIMLAVIVLGEYADRFVRASVAGAGLQFQNTLGSLSRWVLYIFGLIAALSQLKVAPYIVNTFFTALMAMLAIAGGLSFGLGGQDAARDIIKKFREQIENKEK